MKILPTTAGSSCNNCQKPGYFCTKEQNTKSGDSGSAVVYNDHKKGNVIIGVVSGDCNFRNHTYQVSFFIKVTHFLDWIGKETGIKV